MGAGCCRARVLPGGHHAAPGPRPPRPAWEPSSWGSSTDSIASLRPGDKFHFSREPYIHQHLVVPDKPFSSHGAHNLAFTSDGGGGGGGVIGGLAVRPSLPPLSAPPPPPGAPEPPPRRKRRARQDRQARPPPLPPSRTRARASRTGTGTGCERRGSAGADEEDAADRRPHDSILSPSHTMELLQRMAKMEARLGVDRAAPGLRARSMDSLEALDSRTHSLPGRTGAAGRDGTATGDFPELRADGPRSLDLELSGEEGVVGVAAFSLQSWEERRERACSPQLSKTAVLLSPRQWRPVSPSVSPSAPRLAAVDADRERDSTSSPGPASSHHTATTRALSEFIKETYTASDQEAPSSSAISSISGGLQGGEQGGHAPTAPTAPNAPTVASHLPDRPSVLVSSETGGTVADPLAGSAATASLATVPTSQSANEHDSASVSSTSASTESPANKTYYLDVANVPQEGRPGSSASSVTESLGELEDDILHMLSSSSADNDGEGGAVEVRASPSPAGQVPAEPMPRPFRLGDAVPVST